VLIDLLSEATAVLGGLVNVGIFLARDGFVLNGAQEALGVAMRRGRADGRHADLEPVRLPRVHLRRRSVRPPLGGVLERGPMRRPRPRHGGPGQGLVPVAAQMPTAKAAGIALHADRQGHELSASMSLGHISTPDVLRAHNRQALHAVRVARVGLVAVRGPQATPWALSLQPHVAHEPRPGCRVALEVFTAPSGGDAPIARGRPCLGQPPNRRVPRCCHTRSRLVGRTAARLRHDPADLRHGIVVAAPLDDLPRGFDRGGKRLVACFQRSFASVKRPTKRSNAAIRCVSWRLDWSGPSTMEAARDRQLRFQSATTEAASWCSRQSSALLVAPDRSSSTTWALHAAVNWRRCVRGPSLLGPLVRQ
jgi:hypothetical protein